MYCHISRYVQSPSGQSTKFKTSSIAITNILAEFDCAEANHHSTEPLSTLQVVLLSESEASAYQWRPALAGVDGSRPLLRSIDY